MKIVSKNSTAKKEPKQVLLNTKPELIESSWKKCDGLTLQEVFTLMRLDDVKRTRIIPREKDEFQALKLFRGNEVFIVPFSKAFTTDESYLSGDEMAKGEFHVANRRTDDDPEEGPFKGPLGISFGYAATVETADEESYTEEEKPQPATKDEEEE